MRISSSTHEMRSVFMFQTQFIYGRLFFLLSLSLHVMPGCLTHVARWHRVDMFREMNIVTFKLCSTKKKRKSFALSSCFFLSSLLHKRLRVRKFLVCFSFAFQICVGIIHTDIKKMKKRVRVCVCIGCKSKVQNLYVSVVCISRNE